jgi:two-component system, OmpR family, sensor kinase
MSQFVQSGTVRHWRALQQLPGRTPLRIKLITAVLALVVIALAVISVASIALFRDYQIRHASQQAVSLFEQTQADLAPPHPLPPGYSQAIGAYLVAIRETGTPLSVPTGLDSVPAVPTDAAWLNANAGKLVNVPGATGNDNWRVITQPVTYTYYGIVNQRVTATLIVGVDLGDINGTIGRLAYIDLVVSAIVVVALAIAGIAVVRASLRPLADIESTAQAIAAGDLSRRVPDRDPRTEVGRLGRALNTMLAQIESAFHARERSEAAARHSEDRLRRFLADASHELRTPLTAIRGYAEYYRQRGGVANGSPALPGPGAGPGTGPGNGSSATAAPGAEPGTARPAPAGPPGNAHPAAGPGPNAAGSGPLSQLDMNRIMERVEQESARMGGLVEDMLMLARLDQQRPIERRPVDLLTLAADAVQDARIVAPSRKIGLTVGAGTAFLVLGDEGRLRQVISNLMNNALTHTPDGTPITVRILAGDQAGNPAVPCAVLEVADQGAGLTKEQADRVFERFYRADQARDRRTGGSGLGLAIVDALVSAHGGTVGVDTAPGRGSTFRITLPLAPEAAAG